MCFTPESPSALPVRFNSLRCEGFEDSADVKVGQLSSVMKVSLRLKSDTENKNMKEETYLTCFTVYTILGVIHSSK